MTSTEREQIRLVMQAYCEKVWRAFRETYPQLGAMPAVQVSGRLTRTAGRCWQPEQIVEFGTKFLMHSRASQIVMIEQIVPHELAHAADWQLYGQSEMKCGHGRGWREIMVNYGLPPNRFHRMDISE